ncbi:Helix-turn-helix domain-containing protein [Lentzea albidocapillata subsp. violacea]|uniref:Helix-turn-helix domain-containing protein n=1 Tax=Lentzea albidocapillata subsp. violacea TaxID=128104 RepID=A0A1G9AIA7_9PSEU|nr:helix-turn-helix transcriptional regulator [Lentzea albidocapillata]SDK26554.1 Helix-turn-helix domain-containing protein [Lentzea albidocapillata subsp. violacea]
MTVITSTAHSRELGDELRRLRETCTDLGGRAMAIRLGWDPSKMSTIEHGKARASEVDLVQFLTACGKDADYLEMFRRRYEKAFDEYVIQMHDDLRTLVFAESTAKTLTNYTSNGLAGLIQTPEYADALYRLGGFVAEERIPDLVRFRGERQAILRRHNGPKCLFYVHELALRLQIGDASIMADQYARLLFDAHLIRVVPAHIVIPSSGCVLWEYEKAYPVAFGETDLAKLFVQDPGAIARTRLLFNHLDQVALDAGQSRSKLAEYVGQPRGDLDVSGPYLA